MTRHPALDRRPAGDAGLTLVELLVAMGIFGLLMVVISAVFGSGLRTIAEVTASSNLQQDQQNAILWISRLLRYTDNPKEGGTPDPAITAATPTSITFYTYSGTGPVSADRKPYLATLRMDGTDIVTEVTTPAGTAGAFTWPGAPMKRVLVRGTLDRTPTLQIRYYDGNGTELVPPADPAAVAAWGPSVDSVRVTLSDVANDTGAASIQSVDQTVKLVNPR